MANTYTDLVAQVKGYLDRPDDDDFNAQIPNFVEQAQIMIARDKKFLGFLVSLTSTFVPGDNGAVQKPDRWRSTKSWNFGTGASNAVRNVLYKRDYDYLRVYWPNPTTRDVPKYYADWVQDYWLVTPTPDAAYPFEVLCYMTPTILDASNQTNWLTDYCPDLLLNAVLLQAAPYLKNDSRIGTWKAYYDQGLQSQANEFSARVIDNSVMVKSA